MLANKNRHSTDEHHSPKNILVS